MAQITKIYAASSNHFKVSKFTDPNGNLMTNANASYYATVVDGNGKTVQASTPMTYTSVGQWDIDIPSTVWVSGNGPWTITLAGYDQTHTILYKTTSILGLEA